MACRLSCVPARARPPLAVVPLTHRSHRPTHLSAPTAPSSGPGGEGNDYDWDDDEEEGGREYEKDDDYEDDAFDGDDGDDDHEVAEEALSPPARDDAGGDADDLEWERRIGLSAESSVAVGLGGDDTLDAEEFDEIQDAESVS